MRQCGKVRETARCNCKWFGNSSTTTDELLENDVAGSFKSTGGMILSCILHSSATAFGGMTSLTPEFGICNKPPIVDMEEFTFNVSDGSQTAVEKEGIAFTSN